MNKVIKKAVALALSGMLIASCFAGCSSSSDTKTEGTSGDANKTYTVGICQAAQHPALDAATQGFEEALKAKLGDKVKIEKQNASGESSTCATIVNQYVSNGVDLIMANATDALVAASNATNTIPIVGTSITSYGVALNLEDKTATKTGINVTGTADLAPLDKQAAMIKEWFPDAKKVGILYASSEKNSKYQADVVSAELKNLGLEYEIFTCADTNEIAAVTKTACDASDVIYIPTDNTLASAAATVNSIAEPAKVPIIAGEESICKGCGIATLSISYYDIGYQAGEMAYEILVNGTDPSTMDIQFVPEEKLAKKYSAERCKTFGLTIPEGYEAIQ